MAVAFAHSVAHSTTSRKRQHGNNGLEDSSKKFKCEPCNKFFKEHKSLLRHERENSKHEQHPWNRLSSIVCRLCTKTFSKVHDQERHFREQHSLDGKVPCQQCGKVIRPKTPHKCSVPIKLPSPHDSVMSESSSSTMNTDLSACQGLPEANHTAIMDTLSDQLSRISLKNNAMCPTVYKKQVRTVKASRLLPCGLCRMEFEIHDHAALFQHLKDHMDGFNGLCRCKVCEIDFMSSSDLKKHEASAAKGDCGFFFHHKSPCTGHHPLRKAPLSDLTLANDDDRFTFCYRIRVWEQSQLASYISSIHRLNVEAFEHEPASNPEAHNVACCAYCQILQFHQMEVSLERTSGGIGNTGWSCPSVNLAQNASKTLVHLLSQPSAGALHWIRRRNSFSEGCRAETTSVHLRILQPPVIFQTRHGTLAPDPAYFAQCWLQILHRACISGDLQLVQSAIRNGANVHAQDFEGRAALHLSVLSGNVDVIELLLRSDARIDAHTLGHETPLFIAVKHGAVDIVRLLIKYGAMNRRSYYGEGILNAAFYAESISDITYARYEMKGRLAQPRAPESLVLKMVSLLLKNGARVDAKDQSGRTAIQSAVEERMLQVVKLLLNHGAQPNQPDYYHPNAPSASTEYGMLSRAIRSSPEIARVLVEHGAIVNESVLTAAIVHEADETFTQQILDIFARIGSAPLGYQALNAAITRSRIDLVQQLLYFGAEPSPRTQGWECYALVVAASSGSVDMIDCLLAHGAALHNIVEGHSIGAWAMHSAVCEGHADVLSMFIRLGLPINDEMLLEEKPMLYLATQVGSTECAQILVENGANLEAGTHWSHTPLAIAADYNYTDTVDYLLSAGADPNAKISGGHTPLCCALRYTTSTDIVQQLLLAGADPEGCKQCVQSLEICLQRIASVD